MATDNLNYYSAWLPAGQQTDRYSSQPWCLRSKNLDIFSSSKSVKATAWRQPTTISSDIIKQDWKLILKTDGKVYDISSWSEVLVVDPSINFPVYQVSYNWKEWTYADAEFWTVQDMLVARQWEEIKTITIFTDRTQSSYSYIPYVLEKEVVQSINATYWGIDNTYWYKFTKTSSGTRTMQIKIKIPESYFTSWKLRIKATTWGDHNYDMHFNNLEISNITDKFYYDLQADQMIWFEPDVLDLRQASYDTDVYTENGIEIEIPAMQWEHELKIILSSNISVWDDFHWYGTLYIDCNGLVVDNSSDVEAQKAHFMPNSTWDFQNYYWYLPVRERELVPAWVDYWLKWSTWQVLYKWKSYWDEYRWESIIRYNFEQEYGWENEPWLDVIGMISWNEQVYMIWNMNWNWYIIPCDLTWWRWTPYISYGCTFKGVTNIDYLMYLVWEDRGISELWVYNGQELVGILWGNQESQYKNLIRTDEQYNFDWKIVEYRDNLILSTTDNRIFEYGQTYGGKWWAFIHELPWTIKELKAEWNNLIVKYTVNSTDYVTALQDDSPFKYYNTEWMAEYPIVLWNHLLEKEESDLFVSYILPSSWCKLEFWGMANHYHFRTFKSSDNYEFNTTDGYYLDWCAGTYELKFIEKNGDQYTFRLEGDLPIQNWSNMKITDDEWVELISYTEYNHFRKIWEITTTEYQEWEFRFHNLNNKLELPKSHSLQIMVKGKGTVNYTPELFALDLVANQRERW